jgi:hypothetical protein
VVIGKKTKLVGREKRSISTAIYMRASGKIMKNAVLEK